MPGGSWAGNGTIGSNYSATIKASISSTQTISHTYNLSFKPIQKTLRWAARFEKFVKNGIKSIRGTRLNLSSISHPKNVVESARRLGIDLNNTSIRNGIFSARINVTSSINRADVKAVVEYARGLGARGARIGTGRLANVNLDNFLGRAIRNPSLASRAFGIRNVTVRGAVPPNDYTISIRF